jgi:translation initiation factor IF-2
MSEHEMVKVYELAKELGIDSISLLDKLKSLNIKVKNHMSELRDEEVEIARTSLRKGAEGAVKAAKKAPVRTKKKTTGDASVSTSGSTESASAEKKATSPIIRRRTKSEAGVESSTIESVMVTPTLKAAEATLMEAAEVTSEELTQRSEAESIEAQGEAVITEEPTPSMAEAVGQEPIQAAETSESGISLAASVESEERHASSGTSLDETIQPSTTATTPKVASMTDTGQTIRPHATSSVTPSTPQGGSTVGAGVSQTIEQKPKPARPPIVLTPRPVAPRKSILKIVEATPPPPRPIIKPAPVITPAQKATPRPQGATDKDTFRIVKMTKENLDQMVEEEAAKKRGGGREAEIRPEDVRFADYRKKELVFLPKKKKIPIGKEIKKTQKTIAKAQKRIVEMQETISVQDLANQLSVKAVDVIRKLMGMGQMATINQSLDYDTATLVAQEYQYEVRNVSFKEEDFLTEDAADSENLESRPPVVTIMGHVDHGKTTLLDAIREANVAGGEAGGITQHIGAYTIEKNGKMITFIDTPGHEAFTVMRARGANVTDIVILVVSADDGVMPQTREALSHAQAAKVPIIVAVNKIDKPGANPEKIKQALAELNLLAEDWGGETMFVPVSALKRTNLDKLLESILLQAEVMDLKANAECRALGTVLEARLEKGKGPVISVLVKRGTLRVGDSIVAGPFAGRVKALTDDKGRSVKSAGPAYAVEVLGLEGVPNAGETFNSTESEADARAIAENRHEKNRSKMSPGNQGKVTLDQLFSKIQAGDVKELNVILKADAFGSVEAIRESLIKVSTEKVKVKPILTATGGITESDVLLASASNAIIIGFNVRPETKARQVAESEHVEVKCYNIIYELIDDVKKAMVGLLDKKKVEKFLGRAEVRQIFSVPKMGTVAGCSVIDGKILRGANLRLLRDSRVIFEGKMSSLRRFKDDVKEVATGFECGIGIENYNDLKIGDVIEAFQIELVTPELSA